MVMLSASVAKKNHARQVPVVAAPVRIVSADPFSGRLIVPSSEEVEDDPVPPALPTRALLLGAAPAVAPARPALPSGLAQLAARKTAQIEQTAQMTRVQMSSAAFFDVGSAVISDGGK